MTTKIVHRMGKSALVAGLTWSPLVTTGNERAKEIQTRLDEGEASRIVIVTTNAHAALGLSTRGDEDEPQVAPVAGQSEVAEPKKLFSLAAAFAALVGDTNAVLAYKIANSALVVVVVVDGGIPSTDDIKSEEEGQSMAARFASGSTGYTYTLYSNNLDAFGGAEYIDVERLWKYADKKSLLVGKPVNVRRLLALVTLIAVVAASGYGYMVYDKAAQNRERIRKAKAADPVPKYAAELAIRIGALGMQSESTIQIIRELGKHPIREAGWGLKNIRCIVSANQCISTWGREGGTTDGLMAARAPFGEEIAGTSTLGESQFVLKVPMKVAGVAARQALPDLAESTVLGTPIYQTLANAGLNLKVANSGYQTWPQVSGIDMKSLPRSVVIQARSAELTAPAPLMTEALRSLPSNFWWNEIVIDIAGGGATSGALSLMSVTVKGNSYVR